LQLKCIKKKVRYSESRISKPSSYRTCPGDQVKVIRVNAGAGSNYLLVHAGQILAGEIGFNDSGHVTLLGMEDEIKAYQLMYDFEAGLITHQSMLQRQIF
jgi:hypothetical protein